MIIQCVPNKLSDNGNKYSLQRPAADRLKEIQLFSIEVLALA